VQASEKRQNQMPRNKIPCTTKAKRDKSKVFAESWVVFSLPQSCEQKRIGGMGMGMGMGIGISCSLCLGHRKSLFQKIENAKFHLCNVRHSFLPWIRIRIRPWPNALDAGCWMLDTGSWVLAPGSTHSSCSSFFFPWLLLLFWMRPSRTTTSTTTLLGRQSNSSEMKCPGPATRCHSPHFLGSPTPARTAFQNGNVDAGELGSRILWTSSNGDNCQHHKTAHEPSRRQNQGVEYGVEDGDVEFG